MSRRGMTLTILATELHEAARRDDNLKLEVHPHTATFGPAVSSWLRMVAEELTLSPSPAADDIERNRG